MRPDQCGTGRRDLTPADLAAVEEFRQWLAAKAYGHTFSLWLLREAAISAHNQLTSGDDVRPAPRCSCRGVRVTADYGGPWGLVITSRSTSRYRLDDDCPHHGDSAYTACLHCYAPLERDADYDWVTVPGWSAPRMDKYCPASPNHDHYPETDQ